MDIKSASNAEDGSTQIGTANSDSLGIIVDFLPVGFPTRPGTRLRPTSLTIHNTDNPNPGANAAAHNRYIRGSDAVRRKVSWHFTVDDRSIYQHLPINEVGWHAGPANSSSLGIEICMHAGMDEAVAYERAAQLCAFLALQLGIPVPRGLRQHHDWTGKNCPSVLRAGPNRWQSFLARVQNHVRGSRRSLMPNISFLAPSTETARADQDTDGVQASIGLHFEDHGNFTGLRAKPIPADLPIAFSASTATNVFWPVVTRHPRAMEVNTLLAGGGAAGENPSRRFLADRNNNRRYHCAVDLYCSEGDGVVAVEDGEIVNFYHFYENTFALIVKHGGYVVNYGEVAPNSLSALGLAVGSRVVAGQRIGTVGRLNMLHFETYSSGTTRNYSWSKDKLRPNRLRNPSQILLDLVTSGSRLDPDQVAIRPVVVSGAEIKTVSSPSVVFAPSAIPPMPEKNWHRFESGPREWRYDERGLQTRENGIITPQRWEISLTTMHKIMQIMGSELLATSEKHQIPPALLLMTIATEAHIYASDKFTGPRTFRWEAHVKNRDIEPATLGDYSAGPMQSLGTTARWVIRTKGEEYGLSYNPFDVAPVFETEPNPRPSTNPLYEFGTSLNVGAAVIRIRSDKSGFDPILVAAAYNTGGLYKSAHSPWGLRAYGDHLDRAAKWYGDACACLIALGVA